MHSPIINLLLRACNRASSSIARDFVELEKLQISRKSLEEFVTNADLKSEKAIIRELTRFKPDFGILSEESGEIPAKIESTNTEIAYRWIIDPIDGTNNFMHGNPNFCISIGLEATKDDKSEIVAGVIHCPILRETYWAEKGKGAYILDEYDANLKIRIGNRTNINETLCATRIDSHFILDEQSGPLSILMKEKTRFRISGSAALDLAYLASGKVDISIHHSLKPWDIAAGIIIVREAGGKITNFAGEEKFTYNDSIVATNLPIYRKIIPQHRKVLHFGHIKTTS